MLPVRNILIGITGSIAAYKSIILIRLLKQEEFSVKIIQTESSKKFVTPLTLSTLSNNQVFCDFFDTKDNWVNHVELAEWADIYIIAPATSSTISKLSYALSNNLLVATFLSFTKKVYIAPAMDLEMYKNPLTTKNIAILKKQKNIKIITPEEGFLASGLYGKGRMAEPQNILKFIKQDTINNLSTLPLHKKKILITAGGTREKIDPVRYIGNFSSGKMGIALVQESLNAGAEVTLIYGNIKTSIPKHHRLNTYYSENVEDFYKNISYHIGTTDLFIMAAAISDYTIEKESKTKIKKNNSSLTINLKPSIDILKTISKNKKKKQTFVGFALETENIKTALPLAKKKLVSKNLDFIVLNNDTVLNEDKAEVTLISKTGSKKTIQKQTKSIIAKEILKFICQKI